MEILVSALKHLVAASKANFLFALGFLAIFLLVHLLNKLLKYRLNRFGILPRTSRGFLGIFFSPFLHKDFNHLFFNAVPLFVLANLLLLTGSDNFYLVTLLLIFGVGFMVWLFGQKGIHIGASGLIMGYFGYLLTDAYFDWNVTSVILAILSFYYLGGLLMLLVPSGEKGVSWAAHFWGFVVGIVVAYFYPYILAFISGFPRLLVN